MSTDNTSNASQTLFRFVSLRNPQLTETKEDNLGFIHRPENILGVFDTAILPVVNATALIKFSYMERETENFSAIAYTSEKQISENGYGELLKLGNKISRKEKLSDADNDFAVQQHNYIDLDSIRIFWDNLIYQVITQKDFYVKEAIINILKALHYGKVFQLTPNDDLIKINGENLTKKALEAKVVLPINLFGDGNTGHTSSTVSRSAFTVGESIIRETPIDSGELPIIVQEQLKLEGEKITELTLISQNKQSLENLKTELEKIEKSYYKAKTRAYEVAYKEYSERYQPEIDAYNEKLDEIESQITESMSDEEIRALYAELGELNVPSFEFNYKDELNFEDFNTKLSADSLKLFVSVFTDAGTAILDYSTLEVISDRVLQIGEISVKIDDDFTTYFEVFEMLNEDISSKTQALFDKSPLHEKLYANLGGVLIPINESTEYASKTINRSYYLIASQNISLSRFIPNLTFYYQAENNYWGLATAKMTISSDIGIFEETVSNINIINNKVTFPATFLNKFGSTIHSLSIKIYFNNGEEASVELSGVQLNTPYTGILYTERTKEETGTGTTGTTNPKPAVFMRKNFGIKRLGIADYMKVVQSTHAYVPGEVSNIENVMASELRHKSSVARDYSEITDTTSESVETEKISDTTKTERNEMQTEVAKEMEKQQSITASTNFSYNTGVYKFDIGAGYANNTAQHDSNRQAVAKSQEITERAMERVLTKINKERVQKIIKEYTETNVHEFDNRGKIGSDVKPEHITGVYRWVDKKMKNQIYNYGKRSMFEFMIPEPAKLHRLASFVSKETLKEPIDPRKAPAPQTMATPKDATKDLLTYWAGVYGVTLTPLPDQNKVYNIGRQDFKLDGDGSTRTLPITIPDNYTAKSAKIMYGHNREKHGIFGNKTQAIYFSNFNGGNFYNSSTSTYMTYKEVGYFGVNITGQYGFTFRGDNLDGCHFAFSFNCELSTAFIEAWKKENFDTIIKAYEAAYADFLVRQKELDEKAKEQERENKEKASVFHRDMESVILKHNCIAYLLQDYLTVLGQNFTQGDQMKNFQVILGEDLDQYTALVKFLEQAFEWSIMDYTFYPYYWAHREEWQKMYLTEDTDPLFRNFLQAGMARVIVTVKPGFEDAVQFFMSTGRIWNGGEVPVIGDPMYMSIADEMKQPTGEPQGKFWITRIPTTLTILQAKSVGLEVDEALPTFPEDNPDNCENPRELETESPFKPMDIQLQHGEKETSTLD